jgi:uncharacterized protein YndB with AHSA1/START domain
MTPATINATHDDLRDLYISRVIKAPPQIVWRAWAEVELFEKWWTPKPVVTKVSQMRFETGGVFGTDIVMPNGDAHPSVGCFLQVIPNQQIIFTDALSGGFRPTKTAFMTVIIDFNPHSDGCEYSVRIMHQSEEDKHRHKEMGFEEGWTTTIAQLAELVEAL